MVNTLNVGLLGWPARAMRCGSSEGDSPARPGSSTGSRAPETGGAPSDREGRLALVPIFASLSDGDRQALAETCRRRHFRLGQVLFHEGDPGSALYLLLSGQVKIVRESSEDGEIILHVCGPGECLGEMALLDGAPRSATAEALERVEALMLYREEFLALLDRRPTVARAMMGSLAERVRRLNEQLRDAARLDVAGRLAKTLLALANQHGQDTPEGIRITLRLTQAELAQMVGAARQTVTTQLSWFRDRGILSIGRNGITLHRPDLLGRRVY
jgi:CRP/FNR family transcriptional regulator, cyclic AMP receptor protein